MFRSWVSNCRDARWRKLGSTIWISSCFLLSACGAGSDDLARAKVDKKYGVPPSPKLVEYDWQTIPRGGGRYMVGKPYRIAGKRYVPREQPDYRSTGKASWYGGTFHGRQTANGEIFDKRGLTAAHTTLPLPSYVRVTNKDNGRSMVVRVNDRGPFHGNRIIDVSERVAELLNFKHRGIGNVEVRYMGRAAVAGSDEQRLLASLSGPGVPARQRIKVADATSGPALPPANLGESVAAAASPVPKAVPTARPSTVAAAFEAAESRPAGSEPVPAVD